MSRADYLHSNTCSSQGHYHSLIMGAESCCPGNIWSSRFVLPKKHFIFMLSVVSMVMQTSGTCGFWSHFGAFLHTAALLDSRGSLSEAGISSTTRPGALCSDGDAEEVPPSGVQTVKLNRLKGNGGTSATIFTFYWQLEDWTPGTRFTPLIFIQCPLL